MTKEKLTKPQLRHIWALARDLKIADEYLYCIVFSVTGSESISSLTKEQAKKVIFHLLSQKTKKDKARKGSQKTTAKNTNIIHLEKYRPTQKQKNYVSSLKRKINQSRQKVRIEELSQRMFDKTYNQITKQEMIAIIEALKSILSRRTEKHI